MKSTGLTPGASPSLARRKVNSSSAPTTRPDVQVLLQDAPRQLADSQRGERLGQLRGEHVGQRPLGVASACRARPRGPGPPIPEKGLDLVLVQEVWL